MWSTCKQQYFSDNNTCHGSDSIWSWLHIMHLVFQLPVSLGHMWELTQVEWSLTPPINSHPLTSSSSSFTSQWYVSTRSLATGRWPLSAANISGVRPSWGLGGTWSIQYTDNNLHKWSECKCKWTECWWWCAVGLHVCVYHSYSTLFTVVVCGKFVWYVRVYVWDTSMMCVCVCVIMCITCIEVHV